MLTEISLNNAWSWLSRLLVAARAGHSGLAITSDRKLTVCFTSETFILKFHLIARLFPRNTGAIGFSPTIFERRKKWRSKQPGESLDSRSLAFRAV
jgi:hypothetical protein